MGTIFLISCILTFVLFGYYIMYKIDAFMSSSKFLGYHDDYEYIKKTPLKKGVFKLRFPRKHSKQVDKSEHEIQ